MATAWLPEQRDSTPNLGRRITPAINSSAGAIEAEGVRFTAFDVAKSLIFMGLRDFSGTAMGDLNGFERGCDLLEIGLFPPSAGPLNPE